MFLRCSYKLDQVSTGSVKCFVAGQNQLQSSVKTQLQVSPVIRGSIKNIISLLILQK